MPRIRSVFLAAAIAVVLPLTASTVAAREAVAPCSGDPAPDEWPTFGRDLANSRRQDEAGEISTTTAPMLAPVWRFVTGAAPALTSDLNGTPIVSGGCVFLNTAAGDIIALDAASGAEVWRVSPELGGAAALGGYFVSSPAVADGVVYVLASVLDAPVPIALSAADGSILWTGEPMATGTGFYTNATPVLTERYGPGRGRSDRAPVGTRLLLAGYSPAEGDATQRGGIAIYDADTGALVTRVHSIPDEDFPTYAGGGIWTAPAIDDDGYAYVSVGNPFSKTVEHEYTNAITKVDVDPRRDTFGTIVDHMKGETEQYREEVRAAIDTVCETYGEDPNLQLLVGNSAPCLQLDFDFGSPPTLFTDSAGTPLVGALQKSGVFHAARTDDMEHAWLQAVGVGCAPCNAAAWAFDGTGKVIGASSPVGTMAALDADDGLPAWASPIADGTHYESTSIAGGVAFTVDNYGNLLGWDAALGIPLLKRPVVLDAPDGTTAGWQSSGVAIASGMVIVATGNVVAAYAP